MEPSVHILVAFVNDWDVAFAISPTAEVVDSKVAALAILDWMLDRREGNATGGLPLEQKFAWCRILPDILERNGLDDTFQICEGYLDYLPDISDEARASEEAYVEAHYRPPTDSE